ncbi:nucleotidyltransferase family protein [Nocardia sp. N2S4-5]|uniref:nucleotidyltransferase family protein n=1 Tax=Nocardia sp. N2S4-5 TaxID=3351565 RepID=UPI0037D29D36
MTPIRREVEAFWLLNASSLPAFLRPTSDSAMRVFHVDLRHHILEPAMGKRFDMAEWFDRSRTEWLLGAPTRIPSRADFVLDLCVHLYREAVTLTTIEAGKDITLGKYVDIAEVLSAPATRPDPQVLIARARQDSIGSEVYFALRHTESLLPGSVDAALLSALASADEAYLDEYGRIDGQPGRWLDPITVRAFDYERRRTVTGRSRLIRSS